MYTYVYIFLPNIKDVSNKWLQPDSYSFPTWPSMILPTSTKLGGRLFRIPGWVSKQWSHSISPEFLWDVSLSLDLPPTSRSNNEEHVMSDEELSGKQETNLKVKKMR